VLVVDEVQLGGGLILAEGRHVFTLLLVAVGFFPFALLLFVHHLFPQFGFAGLFKIDLTQVKQVPDQVLRNLDRSFCMA
jgi:hypothetical protein